MTTFEKNFTTGEYQIRLAKTRAAMTAAGLDAIVVCDPSNMSGSPAMTAGRSTFIRV